MEPLTSNRSADSSSSKFAPRAAGVSWACPLLAFVLLKYGRLLDVRAAAELAALLLVLAGLACGLLAFSVVRGSGSRGVVFPAGVGLVLNLLLLLIFVSNLWGAAARSSREERAFSIARSGWTNEAGGGGGRLRTYEKAWVAFHFDNAYAIKANEATGQVQLNHPDSDVMFTDLGGVVEVRAMVDQLASAVQFDLRNQSYTGMTRAEREDIDGAVRSGSVVRMAYDRPKRIRICADVYVLTDATNSVCVLHYYTARDEARARALFGPILSSLRNGR